MQGGDRGGSRGRLLRRIEETAMSLTICTRQSLAFIVGLRASACACMARVRRRRMRRRRLGVAADAVALLPLERPLDPHDLHRRHLVLGAVGRPVRVLGRHHVGAGLGEVKRRVDDAGLHAVRDRRAQHGLAGAAGDAGPVAVDDAARLRIVRMDLEAILRVPGDVGRAAGLCADVILAQDPPRRQQQREARVDALARRHVFGHEELALAAHELVDVHRRRSGRGLVRARPLQAAERIEFLVGHAPERRRQARDLGHDLGRMRVVHRVAERVRQLHGRFPVGQPGQRLDDLAHPRDAPLGVRERTVLLEERRAGQEHVRELGALVQEQLLHDQALERRHRGNDVLRVRVGLRDILALDVQPAERAVERRLEHVRDAQPGIGLERHFPVVLEQLADGGVGHVAVAAELVRE